MFIILLDIESMNLKNTHFICQRNAEKFYGCGSIGRDPTPRVKIHMGCAVSSLFLKKSYPKN